MARETSPSGAMTGWLSRTARSETTWPEFSKLSRLRRRKKTTQMIAAITAAMLPPAIATGSTTSASPLSVDSVRGGGLAVEGGVYGDGGGDGGEGKSNWQRQTAFSPQVRLAHRPLLWITAHHVPEDGTFWGSPFAQLACRDLVDSCIPLRLASSVESLPKSDRTTSFSSALSMVTSVAPVEQYAPRTCSQAA